MNRLFITENEKKYILGLYGLIIENIEQEFLNYANNYINSKNCDEIYADMYKFQEAVNSNKVSLSQTDKDELSNNLIEFYNGVINAKFAKEIKCGVAKKRMKKAFEEQSKNEPEKLKTYMCWFASNITNTTLNSCTEQKITPETPDSEEKNINDEPNNDETSSETEISQQNDNSNSQSQVTQQNDNKSSEETAVIEVPKNSDSEQPKSQEVNNSQETSSEKKYEYEYPGDKNYRYAVSNNHWWAKNIKNNKEFELSGKDFKDSFQTSINNLDRKFPNARPEGSPKKEV